MTLVRTAFRRSTHGLTPDGTRAVYGGAVEERHPQPWRLGLRGERWFDRLLVVVLVLPAPGYAVVGSWPEAALCVAEVAPLWWRRRHPVAVFAVISLASAAQAAMTVVPLWGQVGYPVAVYSVARFAAPRWGLVALGVGLVGAVVGSWSFLAHWDQLTVRAMLPYVLTIGTIVLAAWALGTLGRTRSAYVDALVERNRQLHREAEQRARLAAVEERTRIAREMHDVVAHGLSVIVVQADGARYAAADDPTVAPAALAEIARTGRAALTEMRRTLGVLREDDAPTRPQPGLADLPGLVDGARAAGTAVTATLPEDAADVPPGAGLTTYRVVQEALTNVRKHAGPGASAAVRVSVGDGAVEVEVTDDGRGAAAAGDGSGLGLLGMAERVHAHGGDLETGPRVGGGYRVAARIPL